MKLRFFGLGLLLLATVLVVRVLPNRVAPELWPAPRNDALSGDTELQSEQATAVRQESARQEASSASRPGAERAGDDPKLGQVVGTLRVSVRKKDGRPLAGCAAAVRSVNALWDTAILRKTDGLGAVVFGQLAPASYDVFIASGEARRVRVDGARTVELDFEVPGATVSGRVEDPYGLAAAGADVFVQLEGRNYLHAAVTDAAGAFEVVGVPLVAATLFARSPEFGPSPRYVMRGSYSSELVIRLSGTRWSIAGVLAVQGANASAAALDMIEVRLEPGLEPIDKSDPNLVILPEIARAVRPDASGRFTFLELGCPHARIIVLSDAFAPRVELIARPRFGETAELNVVLRAAAVITGLVSIGAERPASSGFVILESENGEEPLRPRRAVIGADGSFELPGLTPGTIRVRADTPSGSVSGELVVASGERRSWTPTVGHQMSLRVRLAMPALFAIEELRLLCSRKDALEPSREVSLDASGVGVVAGLSPVDYCLSVRRKDGGLPLDYAMARPGDSVDLTTATAGTGRLVVLREDGGRIQALNAAVECEDWTQNCHLQRVGDFWQLGPVKPGTYVLRLQDADGYAGTVSNFRVGADLGDAASATCMLSRRR